MAPSQRVYRHGLVPDDLPALLLGPPRLTLAVAESMTSGRLQAAIGTVPGASRYFLGGITTYSPAAKIRLLGVAEALAQRANAVSADVAAAMALGAGPKFDSDLAVATTGYAEPAPEHGFPEPGAFWAVMRSGQGGGSIVRQGLCTCTGLDRVQAQDAVVAAVLEALADYLRTFRAAERQSKFA